MFLPAKNDYRAYFNWNTSLGPLAPSTASIPCHKFDFTEFEALATANDNIISLVTLLNLTPLLLGNIVGVLISNTNLQQLKPVQATHASCKPSLSSTNATKIYFNHAIPEALHIQESIATRLPTEYHRTKSPSQLELVTNMLTNLALTPPRPFLNSWNPSGRLGTIKVCHAKVVGIANDKGWFYLGCHNCTTKLVGTIGDHWCPSCKVQIEEPLPSAPPAPDAPQSSVITKNIRTEDERLSEEELAHKKPCIQEIPVSTSASTVADA
ncbi:hypothetical protein MKX01_023349 [Papaver californicum]|nr:hypothetical protein MKX01_023349 [Papaver californicum]